MSAPRNRTSALLQEDLKDARQSGENSARHAVRDDLRTFIAQRVLDKDNLEGEEAKRLAAQIQALLDFAEATGFNGMHQASMATAEQRRKQKRENAAAEKPNLWRSMQQLLKHYSRRDLLLKLSQIAAEDANTYIDTDDPGDFPSVAAAEKAMMWISDVLKSAAEEVHAAEHDVKKHGKPKPRIVLKKSLVCVRQGDGSWRGYMTILSRQDWIATQRLMQETDSMRVRAFAKDGTPSWVDSPDGARLETS